jgi:hypothetical protein
MTRVMLLKLFPYSLVSNAYLENINNLDIGPLSLDDEKFFLIHL